MGKSSPIRQTSRACHDDDDAEVDEGDDGEEYRDGLTQCMIPLAISAINCKLNNSRKNSIKLSMFLHVNILHVHL